MFKLCNEFSLYKPFANQLKGSTIDPADITIATAWERALMICAENEGTVHCCLPRELDIFGSVSAIFDRETLFVFFFFFCFFFAFMHTKSLPKSSLL